MSRPEGQDAVVRPVGGVDRAAVELAAWRQVARRTLVEYTAYAETGDGTPADGQHRPDVWWSARLAATLGRLLDACEAEPGTSATVQEAMGHAQLSSTQVHLRARPARVAER